MVTGNTGAGKSTLLNGIVGHELFQEGDGLDPETMVVGKFEKKINDVDVTVYDTPGLQDGTGNDDKYLKDMADKTEDGIDLILYCLRMDTCAVDLNIHDSAIMKLCSKFGSNIFNRAVFVLTFSNMYVLQLQQKRKTPEQIDQFFEKRIQDWKQRVQDALKKAGANDSIADKIQVQPAGHVFNPSLPGRKYWLSDLWGHIFKVLESDAQPVYLLLALGRMKTEDDVTDKDFQKPAEEQPIVQTPAVKESIGDGAQKAMIIGAGIGAGIGGAVGSITGGAVGATAGSGALVAAAGAEFVVGAGVLGAGIPVAIAAAYLLYKHFNS